MTIEEMVIAIQAKLGIRDDGKPGPETWGTIYRRIVGEVKDHPATPADISSVDPRSETNIQTLHPRVRPMARALVHQAAAAGITIKVTSGLRTYAEQDELYKQGRSKPGKQVTGAKGGHSNHNFAIAFDVTIFKGSSPVWESPNYRAVAVMGKSLGLEWGGDWKSRPDEPHYQLRPAWAKGMSEKAMLAELRRRKANGVDAFA